MKIIACALLLSCCAISAMAQESQTGYNFLRLPVGAHNAAVGGDNISLVEDDEALIFSNPALLSNVSDKTVGLNYMRYGGTNMGSAAFNRNVGEHASWAVSAQYMDYGTMKEADENNNLTGTFTAKDIALAGYFAYMLTEKLAGGIATKFIMSYIGSYHSTAMGVDLGLNYYDDNDWSVSLVAKNLGGQLKAYDESFEKMPLDVQLGASKRLTNTPFRFSATLVDMNHWNYKFIDHLAAGVDVNLSESIWIGLGYNFRRAHEMSITDTSGNESSHGAGFSMGAGLNLERFKLNLAYGTYHVSNHSIIINIAYSL